MHVKVRDDNKKLSSVAARLQDVAYYPEAPGFIFSTIRAERDGHVSITGGKHAGLHLRGGGMIPYHRCPKTELWYIELDTPKANMELQNRLAFYAMLPHPEVTVCLKAKEIKRKHFERICQQAHVDSGHTNIEHLLSISHTVDGLEELQLVPSGYKLEQECMTCKIAKSKAKPKMKGPAERATYLWARVHSDTAGKMRVLSRLGS
eukprot:3483383-Rhodomonas_salina.1